MASEQPAPPAPEPTPEPQPSAALVDVVGANTVTLVGPAGSWDVRPGVATPVPGGQYSIVAEFVSGGAPTVAGKLQVPSAGALTVACDAGMMRCVGRSSAANSESPP